MADAELVAGLWNAIEELEFRLQKPEAEVLTKDWSLSQFVNQRLAIVGGAFAITSRKEKNVILLQTSGQRNQWSRGAQENNSYTSFDVPLSVGEANASMMEQMAILLRSDQPSGEFARQIADAPSDIFCSDEDARCASALPMKALYCGAGEVAFFCLIWRLLLHIAEAFGGLENAKEFTADAIGNTMYAKSAHQWWQIRAIGEAESKWGQFVGDSAEASGLLRNAKEQWKRAKTRFEARTSRGVTWSELVERERKLLGLGKGQYEVMLTKYAKGHLGLESKESQKADVLSLEKAEVFVDAVQLIAKEAGVETLSLERAFAGLHRRVRFPLMPTYYLSAYRRRPVCHALLPLWYSHIGAPPEERRNSSANRDAAGTSYSQPPSSSAQGVHSPSPRQPLIWVLPAFDPPRVQELDQDGAEQSYYEYVRRQLRSTYHFFSPIADIIADQALHASLASSTGHGVA